MLAPMRKILLSISENLQGECVNIYSPCYKIIGAENLQFCENIGAENLQKTIDMRIYYMYSVNI